MPAGFERLSSRRGEGLLLMAPLLDRALRKDVPNVVLDSPVESRVFQAPLRGISTPLMNMVECSAGVLRDLVLR